MMITTTGANERLINQPRRASGELNRLLHVRFHVSLGGTPSPRGRSRLLARFSISQVRAVDWR